MFQTWKTWTSCRHPTQSYSANNGYTGFRVSRLDKCAVSDQEIEVIESAIEYDIRFDYSEDDVDFCIDSDLHEGVLEVCVYEVPPESSLMS